MKAPDKIVMPEATSQLRFTMTESVEYIRKGALMEWLEQNRNQSQMWFEKYYDVEDLHITQVWEKVIDKLNEM